MGGMDENVPVIGDWFPSNPSPRSLFSELIAKEYSSRLISDDFLQRTSGGTFPESKEPGHIVNVKNQDSEHGIQFSKDILMELDSYNVPKPATRGGLSERIAGRAGFGNLTLDTSQIRKNTASFTSPTGDAHSPLLTIPPGLSPTTLLDSPIFLYNSLDDLSPSTGRLAFVECDNAPYTDVSSKIKNHTTEDADLSFSFKLPMTYFSGAETKPGLLVHQSNLQNEFSQLSEEKDSGDTLLGKKDSNSDSDDKLAPLDEPKDGDIGCNPIEEFNFISLGSRGEDGFNWRKYGQKQMTKSEFPRSYYKCTYPNCKVKKKVERSPEGHITEIVYTGFHNHSNSLSDGGMQIEGIVQNDWKQVDLDANQVVSNIEKINQSYHEAPDGIKASLLLNDGDVEDEHVPHGSVSLGDGGDGDGDENEFKRRKLDACALEMSAASRAVREPRIVLQTTSEVDILDDGYRWRKYGQKVVKGNPNPRSYYKCTNPGCSVRKHIERASHDLKSVITTYEGKHNHEVPAARNNGQSNSLPPSSNAPTAFPSCLLPKKAEPARMPDTLDRFEIPLPLRSFTLPGMEQPVGAAVPNFSYAMAHQSMKPSFSMASLGNMPMKMPLLPPLTGYMPQHCPLGGVGLTVPQQAPKEKMAAESELPVFGDSMVYHMLSRMPLGPQL